MLPLLAIAASVIIGSTLIARYWNSIKDWIIRAAEKVKEFVKGIVFGVRVFAKKLGEAYKEISRHYSKNKQGSWEETTVTRKIDSSDVPSDILKMASSEERDITDKLELQLQ